MIQITDALYIGDSHDEAHANLDMLQIEAILNVAQDLHGTRGWTDRVEYMQVGLIDGPGNPLSAYYAATLALATLLKRSRVLVCCHSGGRSLAVAIMHMNMTYKRSWSEQFDVLRERLDTELPSVHVAHELAFNKMNWRLSAVASED